MFESFVRAIELIVSDDPLLREIVLRSIVVSGVAVILSSCWSIPLSAAIASKKFMGKEALKTVFAALIGLPTVALGLVLYLLFSNSGYLGFFNLLYTPAGLAIGQAILITPLICSFSISAIESVDKDVRALASTLGANGVQTSFAVFRESLPGIVLSVVSGFNRAIGELGVAQMVGGNIRHDTSVMTTFIAQETQRGEIEMSIALTIILLFIVLLITATTMMARRRI